MFSSKLLSACHAFANGKLFPSHRHIFQFIESIELESSFLQIQAPTKILMRVEYYIANKMGHAITFGNNGAYINWKDDPKDQFKKKQLNIHFAFLYEDIKKLAGRHTKKIIKWLNKAFPVVIGFKPESHSYLRVFNPYGYFSKKKRNFLNSCFWDGLKSAVAQTETKRGFKMLMDKWGVYIAQKIIKERPMVLKIFKRMLLNSWAKYSGDKIALDFVKKLFKEAKHLQNKTNQRKQKNNSFKNPNMIDILYLLV